MLAEIINIGDELLIGQVVNTNASCIAEQLNKIGVEVIRISVISDKREDIIQSLKEACGRADIVLITGGLGPTNDDITKYTLCDYFNCKLVFDEENFNRISEFFCLRGLNVTELNRKQAEVPDKCRVIPNYNGTASGMWFEDNGKIIIAMPGVPYEMKEMVSNYIIPEFVKESTIQIAQKTVKIHGIGESFLADKIKDWELNLPSSIRLAYLPQPGLIRLRLTVKGRKEENLSLLIESQISELFSIIPEYIYGFEDETLEKVVGNLLLKNHKTLSVAESCTGGFISHLITSIPGCSTYFKGSVVAYSNEIKIQLLGVNPETLENYGAVSEQTVIEMARGVKGKFNTDYSIAVSGVAGPGGGSKEKPIGTIWVAVASSDKIVTRKFLHGEDRGRNITKAALSALNELRLIIQ